MVAVLLVGAAVLAGSAGWWLRGSAHGPAARESAPTLAVPAQSSAGAPAVQATPPDSAPAPMEAVRERAVPIIPSRPSTQEAAGDADSDGPRAGVKRQRSARKSARRDRAVAERDSGFFSVDALPYATIYIDGESAGITPLLRVPLRPGKHAVRAVSENGVEDRFTITVRAGETVSRRLNLELLQP
jgi:hypothetical protein